MAGSKVPAASSTLRVLRYLAGRGGPVAAASIASALELPRSSVYHLLRVMEEEGFVVWLPEEHLYGLGVAAFELSSAYVRQDPLARMGRAVLSQVVDDLGESAHLATLHGRDVLYVLEERALHRPSLVTNVGVRIPAYRTASGRSLLALLPRAQVRALYPNREAFADQGEGRSRIETPSELSAELVRTRSRGWGQETGEVTAGLETVSVAAQDHRGLPVASVALTFRSEVGQVDDEQRERYVLRLRQAAAKLSARLYGTRE